MFVVDHDLLNAEQTANEDLINQTKTLVDLATHTHTHTHTHTYTVSQKKQGTTILSITSPNVDRFSNFFH